MAGAVYSTVPKPVKTVRTPYRKMVTSWPVPESVEIIERLRKYEPASMSGHCTSSALHAPVCPECPTVLMPRYSSIPSPAP